MKLSRDIGEIDSCTIQRLTRLLRDGNHKFQQDWEKGFILLGNIGVGKSTLAHVLSGRKLKAVMDEETKELVINAIEPLDDIVIGHKMTSEKIPNQCLVANISIWEFPCLDNGDPVEEIARIFYVKRLFAITKQLKFILLVTEASLRTRKGVELFETISSFIDLFKDIEYTEGSVSLVVTKVSRRKNVRNIKKIIEGVLKCHLTVPEKHRVFISKIMDSSLYLMHEPSEEHGISMKKFLDCVDSSGKYIVGNEDIIRVEMSHIGKTLASHFLQTTCSNVNKVMEVSAKAILDARSSLNMTALRVFSEHHENCKDWISSSIQYKKSGFMKDKYFSELQLLLMLRDALSAHQISDISNAVKVFEQALEAFSQYAEPNWDISRQIQDLIYLLQQQYEFVKFFSAVCEVSPPLNQEAVRRLLRRCYESTKKTLENAVLNLCIDESQKKEDYYHQVIAILKNYENFPACMKQLEIANRRLAEITRPKYGYMAWINIILSVIVYVMIVPKRILSIPFRLIKRIF